MRSLYLLLFIYLFFQTVKVTSEIKISQLAKMIGVKLNPKIVDVTRKFGTAESLTEARINCDKVSNSSRRV